MHGEQQGGAGAERKPVQTGLPVLRKARESDTPYIKDLAYREIGSTPGRLRQHETYLVYLEQKRVGFISYCRVSEDNLYIYMMALEEGAQNRGLARLIVRGVIALEDRIKPVGGILMRIYKTNAQALHATLNKYNYKIIKELPRHYVLYRPLDPGKDPVNRAVAT